MLTSDNLVLEIVQGFKIPFLVEPRQQNVLQTITLNKKETNLVSMKVDEVLKRYSSESQGFRKSVFDQPVFSKKERRTNHPVIN